MDLALLEDYLELLERLVLIANAFFYKDIDDSAPRVFNTLSVESNCFLL